MLCCGAGSLRRHDLAPLVAHTSISHSLSDRLGGHISVSASGNAPYTYKWPDTVDVGLDQFEATDLPPGRYEITVADATDPQVLVSANVARIRIVNVVGYDVVDASHPRSRDGSVTARVENATAGCRYLWTNGVVTSSPTLLDASSGTYTVAPLTDDGVFLHSCPPATVGVK